MHHTQRKIPLAVKLSYTLFLAVLVPNYWMDYGPTNFLYFCDIALFFTLGAVWTERPIWASSACVGILLPQTVWMIDFLTTLLGFPMMGMTQYMFDERIPLFTRGLSFFHFGLPILLVYLTFRLGYDRRAFVCWSTLALILLPVCYFFMPGPPPSIENPNIPVNINYVYGFSNDAHQTWMPPGFWLATLMLGLPMLIYWPTHCLLNWKRLAIRLSAEIPCRSYR